MCPRAEKGGPSVVDANGDDGDGGKPKDTENHCDLCATLRGVKSHISKKSHDFRETREG